ncbi:TPA: hypothetical protein L7317_004629 [Escherichia coli]|uniref:phage tail tube protein n=1 Tax=Escherichia coli TaxID=562 RepID=UPI0006B4EF48|nr:phage tail tube protein [Escherichia coli]EEC8320237.1 hypothetical protein [Escherichia coli]EES8828870.1 hypothetical protein [Escherichia coli]EET1952282.1 hypothetical protein [Escherichia coli]EET3626327.1 hypothetical protein [Escherichia coli]EEW0931289.1 hypothetical protein [Escherichia coli]
MIFLHGSDVTVEVGTYTAGSTTPATDFEIIPELGAFPTMGAESVVIDVVTFNSAYNRKLLGTKSVPDIPLTVNYLPDNAVHTKLLALAEDQKRAQFKITYYTDGTHDEGYYAIYNAFISSSTTGGDKDAVVTREFVLAVDGGPLATGIVE